MIQGLLKKNIQGNVFCCPQSWKENKTTSSHPVTLPPLMFFFIFSILFIPQAGVKGKLGRLLGVFEVSFLPKLAEQSAHVTPQRSNHCASL